MLPDDGDLCTHGIAKTKSLRYMPALGRGQEQIGRSRCETEVVLPGVTSGSVGELERFALPEAGLELLSLPGQQHSVTDGEMLGSRISDIREGLASLEEARREFISQTCNYSGQ